MRLVKVRIQNFRAFKDEIAIDVGRFTALIGRNEAGKSTVMEALAVFFETQKIDKDDAAKLGDPTKVMISCEFEEFPTSIVLDTDHATTLQSEGLLNEHGRLELRKTYDCTKTKIADPIVEAIGLMPDHEMVRDLLGLKIAPLKKRLKDLKLSEDGINLTISSEIRARIRDHFAGQTPARVAVPLDSEYGKDVWAQLESHLPSFALFKSDRASTDQDEEAQDPMHAALKEALRAQQDALQTVTEHVRNEVTQIAKVTLKKLRELDPSLASELQPNFAAPDWAKVFKITLSADDGVSVNKRGSGVRRLILLSFFRARAEREAEKANAPGVIYAVEEPETSQHPDNQRMLCHALAQLSEQPGCQVFVTTHTPGLARTLPLEALRYLEVGAGGKRVVHQGTNEAYERVCKALGVHADHNVKLFVSVEGANDIEFLKRISVVLSTAGEATPDLAKLEGDGSVIFLPVGGSNLVHWKSRLSGLNRPEFHLYDRGPDAQSKYQETIDQVNTRPGCKGVLTTRLELENYIHPAAITAVYGDLGIQLGPMVDVPTAVAQAVHSQAPQAQPWAELDPKTKSKKGGRVKERLNTEAVTCMTPDQLTEHDPTGEVRGWLLSIKTMLG